MFHMLPSLLALPRFSLTSGRWSRSCDSFNPPWLTSRKTTNPRTANRSRRTMLLLTHRIRNMRFMPTTDTLYRVTTTLSMAPAGLFHLHVLTRPTTSAAMMTQTSPAILARRPSRVKGGGSSYVQILDPLRDQEGC